MSVSEREREARMAVAGGHSLTCSRSLYATTLCNCGGATRPIAHLDAYRAAVRSAVLAEVRVTVEGMREESAFLKAHDDMSYFQGQGEQAAFDAILSALTALEATDGR